MNGDWIRPSVAFMITQIAPSVPVNDTEIAYREVGHGRPLVLLHGGLVSASQIFAATPISYAAHLERLARTFRVIAPDTRAAGGTRHPGGPASATLLCDDVAGLIQALGLERPVVAGFSEGGLTALLLGIRHPDAVGAIVSDAGYDMLNPDAPAFELLHQMLGLDDPTDVDPVAAVRAFSQDPQMAALLGMLEAEIIKRQEADAWPTYLRSTIGRWARWPGYGYADLAQITVPTLVMVGDRDHFCSVEQATLAVQHLPLGELAVLPGTGHIITTTKIDVMLDFLQRSTSS